MKKVLLILSFAAVAAAGGAAAQNIVLGDRVPELKISKWLDDNQPEAAPATYIEFFHSSNPACITSLKRLKEITDKTGAKLRVIVVTKEDAAKVTPLLRPYLSKRIGAALGKGVHRLRCDLRAVRGAHRRQEPRDVDGQLAAIQRKTDRTNNQVTTHVIHQDRPLRKRVRGHASRYGPQYHGRH